MLSETRSDQGDAILVLDILLDSGTERLHGERREPVALCENVTLSKSGGFEAASLDAYQSVEAFGKRDPKPIRL